MNKKNNINIVDCTLRDGGYYNNWNFSINLAEKYLNVMKDIKIDYVEIGFRSLDETEYKGPFFYSTDEFLKSINIPKKLKIGVMVNASELINSKYKDPLKCIKNLFVKKIFSRVSLVRIACHLEEIEKIISSARWLIKSGYKVGLNLMQIANKTPLEIKKAINLFKKSGANIFYFADSMGGLNENDTKKIISNIRESWSGDIGIHTHDNMGRALTNTLSSINQGVKWVDSTVMGMGRGPGNTKTEYLVLEIEKRFNKKISYFSIVEFIEKEFKSLKKEYNWGSNLYYYLAGIYNIHPSFIQGMVNDKRFGPEEILTVIENLKSKGGKKFNKEILEMRRQSYSGKTTGTWEPKKTIKGRDVLILGSGPGVKIHSKAIERFIIKNKPFVIGLNIQKNINAKLVDMMAACHTLRLLTDINKYKKIKQPIILPLARLSKNIKKKLINVKIKNYGIQVKPNVFNFGKSTSIIPNSLVISYVLAISNSAKAKKIYLAGFDGYPAEDSRRIEMDKLISLYESYKNVAQIISITQTKYKIKSTSVYSK